jgi:phosphoglycolate phosphatase
MQLNVDNLIFDIDGTLWDASNTAAKAWNITFQNIGITTDKITKEDIRAFSGIPLVILLNTKFKHIGNVKTEQFIKEYSIIERETLKEGGVLFEGVTEVLKKLSESKGLYIVSNCLEGYVENFLEYSGLGNYIKGYEYSGIKQKSKGENIKVLISKHELQNAVYVGDTKIDKNACKEANIPFIYAAYGFGKVKDAKYFINDIKELLEIVK